MPEPGAPEQTPLQNSALVHAMRAAQFISTAYHDTLKKLPHLHFKANRIIATVSLFGIAALIVSGCGESNSTFPDQPIEPTKTHLPDHKKPAPTFTRVSNNNSKVVFSNTLAPDYQNVQPSPEPSQTPDLRPTAEPVGTPLSETAIAVRSEGKITSFTEQGEITKDIYKQAVENTFAFKINISENEIMAGTGWVAAVNDPDFIYFVCSTHGDIKKNYKPPTISFFQPGIQPYDPLPIEQVLIDSQHDLTLFKVLRTLQLQHIKGLKWEKSGSIPVNNDVLSLGIPFQNYPDQSIYENLQASVWSAQVSPKPQNFITLLVTANGIDMQSVFLRSLVGNGNSGGPEGYNKGGQFVVFANITISASGSEIDEDPSINYGGAMTLETLSDLIIASGGHVSDTDN